MNRSIYPTSMAEMLKKRAGEQYRPSHGTEGVVFMEAWCAHCSWNTAVQHEQVDGCQIIGETMLYDVDDPNYPKEWIYGEDGQPKCTGFADGEKPIVFRDQLTGDMFEGEKP